MVTRMGRRNEEEKKGGHLTRVRGVVGLSGQREAGGNIGEEFYGQCRLYGEGERRNKNYRGEREEVTATALLLVRSWVDGYDCRQVDGDGGGDVDVVAANVEEGRK